MVSEKQKIDYRQLFLQQFTMHILGSIKPKEDSLLTLEDAELESSLSDKSEKSSGITESFILPTIAKSLEKPLIIEQKPLSQLPLKQIPPQISKPKLTPLTRKNPELIK